MPQFNHLHCHTQYSLLDGAASIKLMMAKAKADGMRAVALTDHGNMFGAFHFVNEAEKAGVMPIVGCEFYVVEDRHKRSFTRGEKDQRYHQLILARNQQGYTNLSKLCSLGYIEGLYGKYPRIDRELIKKYSGGLIATTCCIGAEVPQAILHKGEEEAEKVFLEWREIFGEENYFIELQRHNLMNLDGTGISQEDINQVLIKWSKKYNVPVIATNDSHYVNEDDFNAHDILLCVNTGDLKSTPIGDGKGFRFGFPNNQFFFKSQKEMEAMFSDIPEALNNTNLIADMITPPKLSRDVLLPNYTLPPNFSSQDEYLRYLTFEGALRKYGELRPDVVERLEFELRTISNSGYPGYFLIVQDFTTVARQLGVAVGPGRGSAAGSAVAYALGITNVDPIKYNLLFERFLNPERVSMPDIDIDFDDEGRQKVIDYVVNKYGKNQVAQIITYGSMAAKSSLRDVGRVLNVPLSEVDKVAKSFPNHLKATLNGVLKKDGIDPKLKADFNNEQIKAAEDFRKLAEGKDIIGEMITTAQKLEGSVRNTGIHACGVIITPEDITNFVPCTVAKDSDLLVTQFDNSVVEKSGLLKMDFLGLKTLTIIKDAVILVKERHGIEIDPEAIPLDDELTYQLFQRGETNGIFQYESPGMQKNLKALKPTNLEDLIAMNALYRPGPMKYIANFVARKHGKEKVVYDLPECEEYLKDTYGITVYQEQVMLLSQKLAGFSKGNADTLRKAMGKKLIDELNKMKSKFLDGCAANGHDQTICEKIWNDWEDFASYAFNKSHSTCYAYLAFQTAYLKAHYPAEYMASVLTHNMHDIASVKFFLQECKRMGLKTLGPDVNESDVKFTVNKDGAVRFALTALKGVGELAVEEIVRERKEKGSYKSIFDLAARVNLRTVNKKAFESLAYGGGFDCFDNIHRAQYFASMNGPDNLVENAIKYGHQKQVSSSSMQNSLFGESVMSDTSTPPIPVCEAWNLVERLNKEKEVTGIFLSGHPLDDYTKEIESFCTCRISEIEDMKDKTFKIAGIISATMSKFDKSGNKFARFTLEDFSGSREFAVFRKKYLDFKNFIDEPGALLYLSCSYMPQKFRNGEYEVEIISMELLSEVREKLCKHLSLAIDTSVVDGLTVATLTDILGRYPGKKPLHMTLFDKGVRVHAEMSSKKYKVELSHDMVRELTAIPGLSLSYHPINMTKIYQEDQSEIVDSGQDMGEIAVDEYRVPEPEEYEDA